jgi:hypothetical protein
MISDVQRRGAKDAEERKAHFFSANLCVLCASALIPNSEFGRDGALRRPRAQAARNGCRRSRERHTVLSARWTRAGTAQPAVPTWIYTLATSEFGLIRTAAMTLCPSASVVKNFVRSFRDDWNKIRITIMSQSHEFLVPNLNRFLDPDSHF